MIVRVPSNQFLKRYDNDRIDRRCLTSKSNEKPLVRKSYCDHVCEAVPLICKNFKMKMSDHLLLGGEHTMKISPGFNSPMQCDPETTPEEKREIVLASPSFGMFSLFKYHLKYGYLNTELKKSNKIYCSHIFSLIMALPILVFMGQWLLYTALISHEIRAYNGTICDNRGNIDNKLMISGICLIYFVRSFFLWDNITNSISLKKMNKVNSFTAIIDTFQEFFFTLVVYVANIWVVFLESDIQNMILNSLAMEFLMVLDNEFEELYFRYVPGSAEDIYDNIFVSYEENIILLEDRQREDKCFRCFSCTMFIPYKLLVLSIFLFPALCFFMVFVGPFCK